MSCISKLQQVPEELGRDSSGHKDASFNKRLSTQSIFRAFTKRSRFRLRSSAGGSGSSNRGASSSFVAPGDGSFTNQVYSPRRELLSSVSLPLSGFRGAISRDLAIRRSFEVKRENKGAASRYTPQCARAHHDLSLNLARERVKSTNACARAPDSDEDDEEDDVFDAEAFRPFNKPLTRSHTHPKQKTKSISSGCISNESGYGTMTRKGVFARTAEDEDVFLHANSAITREEPTPNIPIEDVVFVEALWDHVTMDNEELGFKVGDVIRVIDMTNIDWWWGELDSNEGWFPATFVRILVNQQLNDDEDGIEIVITPSPALRDDDADHYTSRPAATRSRSVGDDLCQCAGRRSNSSVHCPACGRPLREACETPKTRSATNPPKFQEPDSTPNVTRKQSLSRETIRTNVINEIVSSEKVFVGHLKDVVEGYLSRCKNRSDMFTDEQIAIIFGNIEQIYHFQRDFYEQLESAVNRSSVSLTELGNVFLKHRDGFAIYSEYCNNHPQALALLSQLFAQKKYVHFFEACRLLQKMIGIALDGFLLTPVQKICKYPLQLAELLKYTSQDHSDHAPVQSALEAMKGVARMINERKRHMENIKKISLWQSSILNWQDKDVLERSSELVHSGELYTLSQTKGKPKWRMAFLFDHQMILCKKDILRRDLLYYKARVDLDVCELTPLDGDSPRNSSIAGNDSMNGLTTLQRGWRIVDTTTSESACIYCKNEEDFDKWSKAFDVERKLSEVKRAGISEAEEYLARDLVQKSTLSRRAKEASSVRQPVSYRYRVKMAQGADMAAKQKNIAVPPEKSAGFFSNMAGKLTPFRRATTRESSYVF